MNDGEREFDSMIKSMESEVLNLKTAHERPLGALDFFSLTETIEVELDYSGGSYGKDFWIDVTIQASNIKPPICQVGWDNPPNFIPMDLLEYNISSDYSVFSYRLTADSPTEDSAVFKVTAVSSMPIQSISLRS